MGRALADVSVLDLTETPAGSLAAALLGDFGADVIRVEPLPLAAGEADAAAAALAELTQRNKRSLALDLADPEGGELLLRLARGADVLVSDWPRARLEALGLDPARLRAERPALVFARASGFGPEGPDRDLPALDELAAARTGMMPILPQPGQPPVYPAVGAPFTAALLAFGVLTALHHRSETGEGQEVDASLLAGNMYAASLDLQAFLAMGGERFLRPLARLDAGNPMSGVLYRTADERWVCLTMPDTDRWWPGLAAAVGLDPADPRFDGHEKRCGEHRLELIAALEDAFSRRPAEAWRAELDARQLSADVIEEFDWPAHDPQALRNRYLLDLPRPGGGRERGLGFPVFLSESPARLDRRAPALGQHGAQVLAERLGLSEDRIAALEARGVLG